MNYIAKPGNSIELSKANMSNPDSISRKLVTKKELAEKYHGKHINLFGPFGFFLNLINIYFYIIIYK
jgi:hypothetical protein